MNSLLAAWGRFAVVRRIPIIAATVCLLPVLLLTGGSIPFDNSSERYFVTGDPALADYDRLLDLFGDNEYLIVGIEATGEANDIFSPDSLDALARLSEFLDYHPAVTQLRSLSNYQYIHADGDDLRTDYLIDDIQTLARDPAEIARVKTILREEKLALGTLITEDFRHARIAARVEYRDDSSAHKVELVQELFSLVADGSFVSPDYQLHLSGYPLVNERFETVTAEDSSVLIPIMVLLMIGILFISFRSVVATLLPWLSIAVGLLVVLELQYYLGIPHTTIDNSALAPTLIIIGIGITVHVLIEYFHFRNKGLTGPEAAEKTVVYLWRPALFTAVTTSAGFMALSVTRILPIREFAWLGAIGPLVLFLFALTVLPAMLSFIGPVSQRTRDVLHGGAVSRLVDRLPDFTRRHRNRILLLSGLIMLFAFAYLPRVQIDTNYVNLFKASSATREDIVYFDEVFRGMMTLDIILDSGEVDGIKEPEFLARMESIQNWLSGRPALGRINSLVDYLKEINQALNQDDPSYYRLPDSAPMTAQFLLLYESAGANEDLSDLKDFDNQTARLVVPVINMRASAMKAELDTINAFLDENYAELQPTVTGTMVLFTQQDIYTAQGMVSSFLVALSVITVFFVVLFRSFKYGLLSIIPSVLPILLAASVAGFFGIFLDQSAVIVFAMTMGIAVDDAIHVMSRYLMVKRSGGSAHEAISRALNESGRAVVFSSVVLVSGFSVLCFGSFTTVIYVGLFGAIIMALALLGDLLVLPAILYLIDDRGENTGTVPGASS